ncbi:ragulator complex protein LAMTOR3-like isoform X1 [Mytilus californianus]|uniref:ragulator complex protein LAMTOR3-like isoform X1 n=2 Tax=Mytilus californianus TaxID=6549 RepID=UPI0022480326|nr:ragulator complex protein LAMTOR3-like isoform X1 [Mytilus californianus]
MTDEVKTYLMKLINSVDGLLAIAVTDRDGVPLLKGSTDQVPELALRPNFLSTFGTAIEQANKIGFQQSKSFICLYQNYQVVQINKTPVVLTFIADSNTNTGLLLNLEADMKDIINEVSKVVSTS